MMRAELRSCRKRNAMQGAALLLQLIGSGILRAEQERI